MDKAWQAKLKEYQIFLGYDLADLKILERYTDPMRQPVPSYYVDFSGVKTRISYFYNDSNDLDRAVGGIPFPDDTLHAEAIEYIAAIMAVDSVVDSFTCVELGAGYGPWLVFSAKAALRKGVKTVRLIGVEPDKQRLDLFYTHLRDNGLPLPGQIQTVGSARIECSMVHAAISDRPGKLMYGAVNLLDWGGAATDESGPDYRGAEVTKVSVPAITIEQALEQVRRVDFLHIDIQGFEFRAIQAAQSVLKQKVRCMFVATHSRIIEGSLIGLLRDSGWKLIHEKPCKFHTDRNNRTLEGLTFADGAQVWMNDIDDLQPS